MKTTEEWIEYIEPYLKYGIVSNDTLLVLDMMLEQIGGYDALADMLLKTKNTINIKTLNVQNVENLDDITSFLTKHNNLPLDRANAVKISVEDSIVNTIKLEMLSKDIGFTISNISQHPESENLQFNTIYKLVKEFLDQIENKDLKKMDSNELETYIKKSCDSLTENDFTFNLSHAVRTLKTCGLENIDKKYLTLNNKLEELYGSLDAKHFVKHVQDGDLHYYLVAINGNNWEAWNEFAIKESAAAREVSQKANGALANGEVGISAFKATLKLWDSHNTDSYIAFISNKLWENFDIIPINNIEMAITASSFNNSPVVSHKGIFRGALYEGEAHKGISVKFHSFIAKAMLEVFPTIEYLIFTPTNDMREILYKYFEKSDNLDKIFIGTSKSKDNAELKQLIEELPEVDIDKKKLGVYHFKQQYKDFVEKGIVHPITLVSKDDNNVVFTEFTISDLHNGQEKHHFTSKEIYGNKLTWLFSHPFIINDASDTGAPLITIDYKALSNATNFESKFDDIIFHTHINEDLYQQYELSANGQTLEGSQT